MFYKIIIFIAFTFKLMEAKDTPPANTSDQDKGCWEAHNQIRQNPKSFVPDLESMLAKFDGNLMKNEETHVHIRTNEGAAAVQEAIDFLNSAQPLPALKWNPEVKKAAEDHTRDTGPKGMTGHDGSDQSTLATRLERYGKPVSTYGENLSYGQTDGR